MTMQEKMNIADDVEESSSFEDEYESPQKASVAHKLALANQGQTLSTLEADSANSKKRLTFGEIDLQQEQEGLPED